MSKIGTKQSTKLIRHAKIEVHNFHSNFNDRIETLLTSTTNFIWNTFLLEKKPKQKKHQLFEKKVGKHICSMI